MLVRPPKASAAAPADTSAWAVIDGDAEGTVPGLLYSAKEIEKGDNGSFTVKTGGIVYARNVYNLAETVYPTGVGKVPSGTPVEIVAWGNGFAFNLFWSRGTYG